ncbi:MAG: hypothetical protein H6743_03740 [Rickettsiaceae bacterium]|nr:hypothetical protein [Rickettsiaceae bacterium]
MRQPQKRFFFAYKVTLDGKEFMLLFDRKQGINVYVDINLYEPKMLREQFWRDNDEEEAKENRQMSEVR